MEDAHRAKCGDRWGASTPSLGMPLSPGLRVLSNPGALHSPLGFSDGFITQARFQPQTPLPSLQVRGLGWKATLL